jgi:light-regulated signal transduction histidine kinase (bacteriophytochrome)
MAQLTPSDPPAFGTADLNNCDREPIHLAGSVQPHGVLLRLDRDGARVIQTSSNSKALLGLEPTALPGNRLDEMLPALADALARLRGTLGDVPVPFQLSHEGRSFEGLLHRESAGSLVMELSPADRPGAVDLPAEPVADLVAAAVQRFTSAASIGTLADAVVDVMHRLTGYDRVMFYRFDADGHGSVIAEARDPRLPALLGHHYPASDIPKQARALYVLNRVRVLDDVDAAVAPVQPVQPPAGTPMLDMSWCHLRAMSPIHLQYLRNMGVVASMSASLVRDGQLWGLIALHHHTPRGVRLALRTVVELLAEVASTRIAAIENYAHAQVSLLVRRLEQRLIDATSVEGDWRLALLRHPQSLLAPLEATGAALAYEGEILTAGEVPSTAELRELLRWVDEQPRGDAAETVFACSSVERANPALSSLSPTACGVLAVKLSHSRADWLMWFRKEQLRTVTWAGDPNKPLHVDGLDQLSPRRSFAAWSEIVRGTAVPWTLASRLTARAVGAALVDIIVQVHAVRLLIAETQLAQIRATVHAATEPVLVCNPQGLLVFSNTAFAALLNGVPPEPGTPVAPLFEDAGRVSQIFAGLERQPWRGEWALRREGAPPLPLAVRAECVPGRNGLSMGAIVALTDLRSVRRTAEARRALEDSLAEVGRMAGLSSVGDGVVGAILSNASLAAMDIADAASGPTVAPLLGELEASARRATELYDHLCRWAR